MWEGISEDDHAENKGGDSGIATIRLLKDKTIFKGIVIAKDRVEACEEGEQADEVWRRLHDHAARLNPSFYGFDGARPVLPFLLARFQIMIFLRRLRRYEFSKSE
jgi:hypothetical protein